MERRRQRHRPTNPLVLLVDGHHDTRELYEASLKRFGFETTTVADAATLYQQAWMIHPDVIVAEVSL